MEEEEVMVEEQWRGTCVHVCYRYIIYNPLYTTVH